MESLTLCQVNNAIAKSVSVNAVAATKVAGVRINKPSRAIHSTPILTNTFDVKTFKKSAFQSQSIQSKSYATQTDIPITDDAMKKKDIDVEGWIKKHYTPYEGDGSFLAGPTEKTKKLFAKAE